MFLRFFYFLLPWDFECFQNTQIKIYLPCNSDKVDKFACQEQEWE